MKHLFLTYLILIVTYANFAQIALPARSLIVMADEIPFDAEGYHYLGMSPEQIELIKQATPFEFTYWVELESIEGIQSVRVKLGNTLNGGEFFERVFNFSEEYEDALGVKCHRVDKQLWIKLGTIAGAGKYYAQVELKYENDIWSPPIMFHQE